MYCEGLSDVQPHILFLSKASVVACFCSEPAWGKTGVCANKSAVLLRQAIILGCRPGSCSSSDNLKSTLNSKLMQIVKGKAGDIAHQEWSLIAAQSIHLYCRVHNWQASACCCEPVTRLVLTCQGCQTQNSPNLSTNTNQSQC